MKTLLILFSLNAFLWSAFAVIKDVVPSLAAGPTCQKVCDCDPYLNDGQGGTGSTRCTIGSQSVMCADFCAR